MRGTLLFAAFAFLILLSMSESGYTKNYIYPVPPPNDTSLLLQPSYSGLHSERPKKRSALLKIRTQTKLRHKNFHHPHRAQGSLYLYYALPAPACCGETYLLSRANCCAHCAEWQTSYYATFKLAPEDFVYSPSNDDEERSFNVYRNVVVNEVIEDPEYY